MKALEMLKKGEIALLKGIEIFGNNDSDALKSLKEVRESIAELEAQEIMIADYKKRIEELKDAIYAKSKQVDELKAQRMELWMLLDNIDTSEDIAKDSDKLFRNLCRNEYPKRWDIYEPNDIEG